MNSLPANRLAVLGLLLLVAAGCRPGAELSLSEAEIVAPTFSAKTGLFLPEVTRRSLDLKLVEIAEQPMETTVSLSLRVYQVRAGAAHAAGVLTPEQSNLLRPGQSIEGLSASGGGLRGTLLAINGESRDALGGDEILAEFPTADALALREGDFVSARVRIQSAASVTTIPARALLETSEGHFAYTVSGDHFVRTAIQTGARNDEHIEVTDGLYAGDRVVLQPVLALWLAELAAVKGGQACCVTPPKGK